MDTRQKPRTAQTKTRSGGKSTKKRTGLFGIGKKKKPVKRSAPASNARQNISPEEAARRREAAARRRAQEEAAAQAAAAEQAAAVQETAADESIPEMVFKSSSVGTLPLILTDVPSAPSLPSLPF